MSRMWLEVRSGYTDIAASGLYILPLIISIGKINTERRSLDTVVGHQAMSRMARDWSIPSSRVLRWDMR